MRTLHRTFLTATLLGTGGTVHAAQLDGSSLSAWWGLPFAGMLLSIALMPLLLPKLWHPHFGKITAGWMLLLLLPFALTQGLGTTAAMLVHTLLGEYIPFIILLTALFTVAGGIFVRGNLHGSPGLNAGLMAIGAVLASFMGTTGASMLMIRPLIRANDNRKHVAHVIVFFIFIVSNAGGSLTPLGDPPLFLGFLKGVDFFWTARHICSRRRCSWSARCCCCSTCSTAGSIARKVSSRVDPTPDTHTHRHRRRHQLRAAGAGGRAGADERHLEARHRASMSPAPRSSCRSSCATPGWWA